MCKVNKFKIKMAKIVQLALLLDNKHQTQQNTRTEFGNGHSQTSNMFHQILSKF